MIHWQTAPRHVAAVRGLVTVARRIYHARIMRSSHCLCSRFYILYLCSDSKRSPRLWVFQSVPPKPDRQYDLVNGKALRMVSLLSVYSAWRLAFISISNFKLSRASCQSTRITQKNRRTKVRTYIRTCFTICTKLFIPSPHARSRTSDPSAVHHAMRNWSTMYAYTQCLYFTWSVQHVPSTSSRRFLASCVWVSAWILGRYVTLACPACPQSTVGRKFWQMEVCM